MSTITRSTNRDLQSAIVDEGFAFVHGAAMHDLLPRPAASTTGRRLPTAGIASSSIAYMADGGRYRRRRHATFDAREQGTIERAPHQPHFQTVDYNPLNGGVARWFEPVEQAVGSGATMTAVLKFCRALFESLSPSSRAWHVEVHQFRIEARSQEQGRPTPEGLHRDGVDYVLVLLIDRRNIARGVTTIIALDGRTLGDFTLTDPLDAALVDDARVAHGVTPVEPIDPATPAYRDVLVVTYRKE